MRIGPKFKIARKLGAPVFEKTQTQKFVLSQARKSKFTKMRRQKTSYGVSMNEKQKARYTYLLTEKQFSNYVKAALRSPIPSQALFERLEQRLDNVVLRSGFAHTRGLARQLVNHKHIMVNNKIVNISSFRTKKGDVIKIRPGSANNKVFVGLEERIKEHISPNWLKVGQSKIETVVLGTPKHEASDLLFDIKTVLEFYSR